MRPVEQRQPTPDSVATPRSRLAEVALLFVRLGFTAFGGPAAHVALMEDEVVKRRAWLDRQTFLDLIAAINFVPGPNSTELAIELGYLRAGRRGLLTAGICFITPAMCIILPLAFLYVRYGQKQQAGHILHGIAACIVAIVAAACWRFGRTAIKDKFRLTVMLAGAAIAALAQPDLAAALMRFAGRPHAGSAGHLVPLANVGIVISSALAACPIDLVILAAAALAGILWYARPKPAAVSALLLLPMRRIAGMMGSTVHASVGHRPVGRALFPATLAAATSAAWSASCAAMALIFLKVGATLFGSGYVLVSYLQSDLVDRFHWLTQKELLDAIAVGQVTPGPLLTTATFIGYLLGCEKFGGGVAGGIIGGVVATAAIFLPAFTVIAIAGKSLPALRRNKLAAAALDGMNAAVVALILVVAVRLGLAALHGLPSIAIALGTLLALLLWNVNATWLIAAAAILGWVCRM